jgi:REP element-mobilizing transposase RayT
MAEIFEPGYFYHVYNRGNNKENIFLEEDNYQYFLNLVKKYLTAVCEIYSYCLLKNHFHFLIRIKDMKDIPSKLFENKNTLHQPFSNLFNAYAKGFNKAYGRSGSLFQEHPHKKRVTELKYLQNLIAYIHLNPKKHGFINDPKQYQHSSYNSIISSEKTRIKQKEVIEIFDDIDNFRYWHNLKEIKLEGELKEIEELDI